jgi:hypothetical protein
VIVTRVPRWWWPLAHCWFVVCVSTPAYFAAIAALISQGIGLSWYHRVGVAALCLLSAMVVMMLPALVAVAVLRLARGRPGSRG